MNEKRVNAIKTTTLIINALLILLLLICSCSLFITSGTYSPTVFGYSIQLADEGVFTPDTEGFRLILTSPNDKKVTEGDYFLHSSQDKLLVHQIFKLNNDEITYHTRLDDVTTSSLSFNDLKYKGKVIWTSSLLGNLLAPKAEGSFISTMVVIISLLGVILLAIAVFYVMALRKRSVQSFEQAFDGLPPAKSSEVQPPKKGEKKRNFGSLYDEDEEAEEPALFELENQTNFESTFEQEPQFFDVVRPRENVEITAEIDMSFKKYDVFPSNGDRGVATTPPPSTVFKAEQAMAEALFMKEIMLNEIDYEYKEKLEMEFQEDVPSVDDLLNEINSLLPGKDDEWDEDLQIYRPKKY